MRLITRADASLVGGLIASAFILFHRPLRSALDAARAIEGEYHLDLMPALIVLGTVFMYHQYRKRQHTAAEVARAKEEIKHHLLRTRELESLIAFGQMLSNALDQQGLRDSIVRGLPSFCGERPLWVLVKEGGHWETLAVDPVTERETPREVLEDLALTALSATPSTAGLPSEGLVIESTLCFPLAVGNARIGVLGVGLTADEVDPASRRALGVAASALSVAIRNVQLLIETRELSINDSLTGCLVRKPGMALLDTELRRARRSRQPLSVLMMDVDEFKNINDQHGHLCGDLVLSTIGRHLRDRLRTTDHKCRFGGDEFVVILPGTSSEGAERVAEVLRMAVQMEPVEHNGQQVPVTVSIGIASVLPGELDLKAVMARADQALYRSKAGGRNRWSQAPDVASESTPESLGVLQSK
jgi:diguanylate cyclase (GGDEF)-like protein